MNHLRASEAAERPAQRAERNAQRGHHERRSIPPRPCQVGLVLDIQRIAAPRLASLRALFRRVVPDLLDCRPGIAVRAGPLAGRGAEFDFLVQAVADIASRHRRQPSGCDQREERAGEHDDGRRASAGAAGATDQHHDRQHGQRHGQRQDQRQRHPDAHLEGEVLPELLRVQSDLDQDEQDGGEDQDRRSFDQRDARHSKTSREHTLRDRQRERTRAAHQDPRARPTRCRPVVPLALPVGQQRLEHVCDGGGVEPPRREGEQPSMLRIVMSRVLRGLQERPLGVAPRFEHAHRVTGRAIEAARQADCAFGQRLLARFEVALFLHPAERHVDGPALQAAARSFDHLQAEQLAFGRPAIPR